MLLDKAKIESRLKKIDNKVIDPLGTQYSEAQHNNGMHPTADTPALKCLQRCGAAGDAGR